MRRYIFLWFIIFMTVIMTPIKGQSMELAPTKIRVGLFYNNSARDSYRLSSDTGFRVGFKTGQELYKVMNFSDKSLEIHSADLIDFASKKNNIKDKRDALEYATQLAQDNVESYLFFDGSWSVWAKISNKDKSSSSLGLITVKGNSKDPGLLIPCTMDRPVFFADTDPAGLIAIEGRRYRGILEMVQADKGNIQVVNELELEEYLYGVIPKEMPLNWHTEALKAQAVAARTYTIANLSKWQKNGFDIGASSGDQVYGGYDAEDVRTNRAVDETKGQIILYDNKPITAFYHADSGGRTEACKDVFGSDLPYLQPVDDIVRTNSPHSEWELCLSAKDISERVKSAQKYIGEIREISIIERSPTGRVKKILLKGTLGDTIIENSHIRNIFQLKSNFFEVFGGTSIPVVSVSGEEAKRDIQLKANNIITGQGPAILSNGYVSILGAEMSKNIKFTTVSDTYIIRGRGYGHGVGMSQWGAKTMAENGYNYMEILLHYYKNVDIKVSNKIL
jgi:stage II sporulation protein D